MKGVKMDKDKIFSFYEKMYFREIDEMNTILSRYPVLFAGIAIIINIYAITLKSDQFLAMYLWVQALSIIAITVCSVGLLRSLYGVFTVKKYEVFSGLGVINDNREKAKKRLRAIEEFNEEVNNKNLRRKEIDPDESIIDSLKEGFIEFTSNNMKSNDERRQWFHKTIRWIWFNLVLCVAIPILVASITFYKDITMSEKDNPNQETIALKKAQDEELIKSLDKFLEEYKDSGLKLTITNSLSKEKYEEYLKQQAEKDNK